MRIPKVLVVTGTDTEVGKTVVTAALAVCLSEERTVAVFKPAQTGVGPHDAGDVDEVRRLSGVESVFEGVRLRDPLAPTTAARREGARIPSVQQHAETVRDLAGRHDTVIVEGAGGLLVGLDASGSGLPELASHLALSFAFVVVTRAGLGTLNHTCLTVEALRNRGLPVLGLVVGAVPKTLGLAEQTNLDDLGDLTALPLVGQIPAGAAELSPEVFGSSAPRWFTPPIGNP